MNFGGGKRANRKANGERKRLDRATTVPDRAARATVALKGAAHHLDGCESQTQTKARLKRQTAKSDFRRVRHKRADAAACLTAALKIDR